MYALVDLEALFICLLSAVRCPLSAVALGCHSAWTKPEGPLAAGRGTALQERGESAAMVWLMR